MKADGGSVAECATHAPTREQRFDLRRKAQAAAFVCIVKRLDPERVAREQEHSIPVIPKPERVHPAQRAQHAEAAIAVEV
jgi:hypothetical protein